MAEKGFTTIFGLCLILIVALVVKGVQEAETNHAYETTNFYAEADLRNAAESALIEAADKVLAGEVTLPVKQMPYYSREKFQYAFAAVTKTSERLGKITVNVWGEESTLKPYKVNYGTDIAKRSAADAPVYIFFSVAQATNKLNGGKMYRRAFAYVDKTAGTIHFMELPTSTYKFDTTPWK